MSLGDLERLDVDYARFNAERSLRTEDPELTVTEADGLTVLRDPSRPDEETYNRIIGLREHNLDALEPALDFFDADNPQVDVACDHMTPRVCEVLAEHGLRPARTMCWLHRDPVEMYRGPIEGVEVRRIREHEAGLLMDLLGREGEPISDEVRELRQRHYCTDRFRAYVARIDGEPAGWGTLFIDDGRGVLGNAITLAEHRGRGVHSALYRARAVDALDSGLAWIVVDVDPDTIGHRNALRAGMLRRTCYVWWRR